MVEHTVSDLMTDSGIKIESPDGSPLNEQLMANGNGSIASPNGDLGTANANDNTFDAVLESQRAFQKLLGGLNFQRAFHMNPSLIAAFQQQQNLFNFNNNNMISASSPSSSRQTPDRPDDEDNYDDVENLNDGEPEDLSLGKDKKQSLSEGDDSGSGSANTSWSFEEQFKQLYDIKPFDEVRKAWLDDWFSFMQKNNKPVTRIPIMAKQVLDLYELYHLVVKHGGLVEIINKKLWREITKGLNLPPSITSAAFTLRTQYQRYLYDYECDKMNLSTHTDLMAAIESNKREGRRNPTGGSLGGSGNGSGNGMMNGSLHNGSGGLGPWGMPSIFGRFGSPFGMRPEDETALASLSNAQHALAAGMDPQKQLEFFQRAAAEAATRHPAAMAAAAAAAAAVSSNRSGRSSTNSVECTPAPIPNKRPLPSSTTESRPTKMPKLEKPATTNMKLTTKDNQMYVSMEVNGTMYQGVLFAMPNVNSNKVKNNNVNGRSASNSPSPHNFNSSITDGIDMGALSALFGADMSTFNPSAASE